MAPIKNSVSTICLYADNWCVESSCIYNIKFQSGQVFPGTMGIPRIKCIALRISRKLAKLDKCINVLARNRMEDVLIKKQFGPLPVEIAEFLDSEAAEMIMPPSFRLFIEDA